MPHCLLSDIRLHYRDEGDPAGAPVVFLHALGTDLSIWDPVLPLLSAGLRLIRMDLRGHGGTDVPDPPYAMGALVRDAERLMDRLGARDAVVVGLSVGGMVAQALAVKRLDLVRGLVLSNTAVRIGTPVVWDARIEAVRAGGLAAIADATMERWFSRAFRASPDLAPWREVFERQSPQGWIGVASAVSGTDLYTPTATLTLPTLAIAGSEDGSTPPDLVRETADLIAGSRFHLIRGAGHLPMAERAEEYATALSGFLVSIGHPRLGAGRAGR